MWTAALFALLVSSALAAVAALVAPRAKLLAIVLGAAGAFGVPWFAGPSALLRGLIGLLAGVAFMRVIDLVRFRQTWSPLRRVLHVSSVVDTRTLPRAPARIDFAALARALPWIGLTLVGFYVAHSPRLLVRWGGGLLLAYAIIEAGYEIVGAMYRALGFAAPRMHVHPIASLSIGELWGVRWARPISIWLRENCFRPLARRGHAALGLLLGFVASGFGHAYPVLVAIDLRLAAMMFGFFFVQGLFVVVEARLGASRWPRPARRLWTVTIMIGSSPLFVEPALRVLGYP